MTAILSASAKNANITVSGGGLIATDGDGATDHAGRGDTATTVIAAGIKIYFEVTPTSLSTGFGVGAANATNAFADGNYLGGQAHGISWYASGAVYNGGSQIDTVASYTGSDILGIAIDGGNKIWFSVNGVFTGNPATNTGGTSISGMGDVYPAYNLQGGGVATFNFGATTFNTTGPSGFVGFDSSGGPINVVPGEVQIDGATLGVAGVPGLEIVVVPGVVEIVATTPTVAGTFEAIDVVAGITEIVGQLAVVNATAASIAVIPGEVSIVGKLATISAITIVDVVPGEVSIVGKLGTIGAATPVGGVGFALSGRVRIGPFLTANVIVGPDLQGLLGGGN